MKKTVLLLTSATLVLVTAVGAAFAATIKGTNGNDRLTGTERSDTIKGRKGQDTLRGLGDGDDLLGQVGNDRATFDPGLDFVNRCEEAENGS